MYSADIIYHSAEDSESIMEQEYDADTVEELVDTLLDIGGNKMSMGFLQGSITEINGTFSVTFLGVLHESLPSRFGEIDVDPLSLTAEQEYTIDPSFEFTTEHPDVVYENSEVYEASAYTGEPHADLGLLKTLCSEVNLSEDQFVEFAEQDNPEAQVVQHVEVSSHPPNLTAVSGGTVPPQEAAHPSQPKDAGLHFLMTLQTAEDYPVDGIHPNHRLDHVSSVTIGGHRYPASITTMSFLSWEDSAHGQWIHTSDFLADNTEAPKIQMADELERIDWGEFFANDRPWPESPEYPLDR